MATQLAERTANPVEVFRQTLTQPAFVEQLKMALPNHIPVERFIRVAQTAVQNNPTLLDPQKVERRSLFGALTKAAQDGLLPDGREGVIVPYKGKAMWQPMVAGIMTKVRRSGEIANWEVAAVFEKDTFQRLLGDDQRIYHEPFEDGDPGPVVGAYSIVTFRDGTKSRDYMPRWRIEKARAQGTARDSLMWSSFYDEGAIKTVIKHHAKRLPMSTDVEAIIERDDFMQHETAPAPAPKLEAPVAPLSRLDAIEHQISEPEPPVEPEVITEQAEELEAEIEPNPDDYPAETNDGLSLAEQIADRPGEKSVAETKAEELIAAMNAAKTPAALAKVIRESEQHRGAMPDNLMARLEIAQDMNRNRIEPAEAGE